MGPNTKKAPKQNVLPTENTTTNHNLIMTEALFFGGNLSAEVESELDTLIISATRMPGKDSNATYAVIVLDSADLESRGIFDNPFSAPLRSKGGFKTLPQEQTPAAITAAKPFREGRREYHAEDFPGVDWDTPTRDIMAKTGLCRVIVYRLRKEAAGNQATPSSKSGSNANPENKRQSRKSQLAKHKANPDRPRALLMVSQPPLSSAPVQRRPKSTSPKSKFLPAQLHQVASKVMSGPSTSDDDGTPDPLPISKLLPRGNISPAYLLRSEADRPVPVEDRLAQEFLLTSCFGPCIPLSCPRGQNRHPGEAITTERLL